MGNSPSRPNEYLNNNNMGQSAHSVVNDDESSNNNGLDDPDDSRKKQINNKNHKKRKNSLDNNYQLRKSSSQDKPQASQPEIVRKNAPSAGEVKKDGPSRFDFDMEVEIARAFTNDGNPLVSKSSSFSNSSSRSKYAMESKKRTDSTGTTESKNSGKKPDSVISSSTSELQANAEGDSALALKRKPSLLDGSVDFNKVKGLSELKSTTERQTGNSTSDYRLHFSNLSEVTSAQAQNAKQDAVTKKKTLTVQNKAAHDSLQKPLRHIPTPLASLATSSSMSSESTTANNVIQDSKSRSPNSRNTNINLLSQPLKMNMHSAKVLNIDSCIAKLRDIAEKNLYHKHFPFEKWEIQLICMKAREVFLSQPSLLKLKAPVKVVGDVHGQFNDLLRILKLSGDPSTTGYLFLGDYVDRGKQSLETILLLLLYKIKYPQTFFMLRGNHESSQVTKIYGFYDECKRRCGTSKVWKYFVDCFNSLPFAGIINDKIFCVHGGISPYLQDMSQIDKILRPTDIPQDGLLTDLLWSDPDKNILDWQPNSDRGVSCYFSKKNVSHFCKKFQFDLIIRGHMVVEDGYEFFGKKRLVTIFSAPNYCGEFNNWGAVMDVNKDLICSFELLKPRRSDK